ncbi:MAG TPA: 50S ribosomal protein L21 [Planctomycetes bacterium]|nr:50S ribosomal protein L21 [Planctomycetota bacterium]
MYAIIQDGGHQYKVEEGQVIRVQKKDLEPGTAITFDQVAAIGGEGEARFGAPFIDGAAVEATVLAEGRGPKIVVRKFRRRKRYRRKQGHRQDYTELQVNSIKG